MLEQPRDPCLYFLNIPYITGFSFLISCSFVVIYHIPIERSDYNFSIGFSSVKSLMLNTAEIINIFIPYVFLIISSM